MNCVLVDATYTRILVTPDNVTPLLRVNWDQPEAPSADGGRGDAEMLSTKVQWVE